MRLVGQLPPRLAFPDPDDGKSSRCGLLCAPSPACDDPRTAGAVQDPPRANDMASIAAVTDDLTMAVTIRIGDFARARIGANRCAGSPRFGEQQAIEELTLQLIAQRSARKQFHSRLRRAPSNGIAGGAKKTCILHRTKDADPVQQLCGAGWKRLGHRFARGSSRQHNDRAAPACQ